MQILCVRKKGLTHIRHICLFRNVIDQIADFERWAQLRAARRRRGRRRYRHQRAQLKININHDPIRIRFARLQINFA